MIIEELKREHREVIDIINKIEKTGDKDGVLVQKLSKDLFVHMDGEEKFFYSEMNEFPELRELIVEALDEHEFIDKILRKLRWMNYGEIGFMARLKILKEFIIDHVEMEEGELFENAKKIVSDEQFEEIEDNYMEFRERKMGSMW